MGKKATIHDVAAIADVSISTVSRYLKDPKSVKALTAYNIKNAIRELNYEPNVFAQNLRNSNSKTVGFVISHLEHFFGSVCSIVSDYFFERGYLTMVCESDNDGEKERFVIQELLNLGVAGLIVTPSGQNAAYLGSVAHRYKNLVLFDRYHNIGCDAVIITDYTQATYTMTNFMLKNYPCDPLYVLYGFEHASSFQMMRDGAEKAYSEVRHTLNGLQQVYNCKKTEYIDLAVTKIQEDIKNGHRPAVIACAPNFLENAVFLMNNRDHKLINYVDITGFALKDTLQKLGHSIPCIIQDPHKVGILLAEHLYKKIIGQYNKEPGQILQLPAEYHLNDFQ